MPVKLLLRLLNPIRSNEGPVRRIQGSTFSIEIRADATPKSFSASFQKRITFSFVASLVAIMCKLALDEVLIAIQVLAKIVMN